jgi:hypothetical protein
MLHIFNYMCLYIFTSQFYSLLYYLLVIRVGCVDAPLEESSHLSLCATDV